MTSVPTARRDQGALRLAAAFLAGAVIALAASGSAGSAGSAATDEGPGWLGVVEGQATIERAGAPSTAYESQPLLPGDRLTTAPDANVEVVLADATAVFVAGGSEVVFAAFAGESDGNDLANLLLLERGELLLASEGDAETRIDTANASVYVRAGAYRIERTEDSTLVIARRGEAELRTRHGVVAVAEGEQAWIEGDGIAVVERALDADSFERWAAALGERRERLAYEDEGGPEFAYDDFGFGVWEWNGGGFVCVRDCGRAGRTRPPHSSRPGSADDPGRSAVPIGAEPESDEGDRIEFAVSKPWPLDDASVAEAEPAPIAKPTVETDEASSDEASVSGAFVESAEAAPSKPSEVEPANSAATFAAEPARSDAGSTSGYSAPAADTGTSDQGSGGYSAPAFDGGSSAAPPAESPSANDPGAEPNR